MPPSRAFFALSITELQLEVLRHVQAEGPTLLSVALTCKAFTETALDLYWETVLDATRLARIWWDVIVDYVSVMTVAGLSSRPRGENRDHSSVSPMQGFQRPPSIEHLKRFFTYTDRIKSLVVDLSDLSRKEAAFMTDLLHLLFHPRLTHIISPSSLNPLSRRCCVVMPKLLNITWIPWPGHEIAPSVLSSLKDDSRDMLTRVTLVLPNSQSLTRAVEALANNPTKLLQVDIRCSVPNRDDANDALLNAYEALVSNATTLKELVVPSSILLSPSALARLRHHPTLQVLRLSSSLAHFEVFPLSSLPRVPRTFTTLLALRVGDLHSFRLLTPHLHALQTLIIDGVDALEGFLQEEIYDAFANIGLNHSMLEVLVVHLPLHLALTEIDSTPNYAPEGMFILLKLLPCLRLRHLHVQLDTDEGPNCIISKSPYDAVDSDWAQLSGSLTQLKSLSFSAGPTVDYRWYTPANPIRPRATVNSLITILETSTSITHLNIPLNITLEGLLRCRQRVEELVTSLPALPRCFEFWRVWLDEDAVSAMAEVLSQLSPLAWQMPTTKSIKERLDVPQARLTRKPSKAELLRCAKWGQVEEQIVATAHGLSAIPTDGFPFLEQRKDGVLSRYE
ncbi:hypothetical protein FRB90_010999 [Tulasnella sp. 427]|nr:hypothetical protein FRB90_010999 [Tulasnella sp. 427]